MPTPSKVALITRVAELYYERELSQKDIADMLSLSRPMVSRLIAEAKETGVVSIHIRRPVEKREDLATQLLERFNLKEAIVVRSGKLAAHEDAPASNHEISRKNAGAAAAELLSTILRDDDVVGVSWGRDLYDAVQSLPQLELHNTQVVQLAGGLGEGNVASDAPEIARLFGEKLGASVRYLHAPTVVQTSATKTTLLEQAQLAQTITLASQLDIALTGIGALNDSSSSLSKAGYLTSQDQTAFQKLQGRAHLLGYILNDAGDCLKHDYNNRVVAAPLKYLKRARWSIGIATLPQKAAAILATLKGSYFNTLVLSDDVAVATLELSKGNTYARS